MSNNNNSRLDSPQVLPRAFNVENHTLRTNSLVPDAFDEISVTYPDSVTEIFTYKFETTTVATVTITYLDASKEQLVSVTRT